MPVTKSFSKTSVFARPHKDAEPLFSKTYLRFQKPPLSPFSQTYTSVFDRISADGRRKRIKKYAFSNENALVWTGPYFYSGWDRIPRKTGGLLSNAL